MYKNGVDVEDQKTKLKDRRRSILWVRTGSTCVKLLLMIWIFTHAKRYLRGERRQLFALLDHKIDKTREKIVRDIVLKKDGKDIFVAKRTLRELDKAKKHLNVALIFSKSFSF